MPRILHIDASGRPGLAGIDNHGSHSRYLTRCFVDVWQARRPHDAVMYRDIGLNPPSFINHEWIQAAFAPPEKKESWMMKVLAESDGLVDELVAADILVIGAPLYNFGMPAALKAWVDQVVRIGRTVTLGPTTEGVTFVGGLADRIRHAVILSARGGAGFDPGGELEHMNHLEPGLSTALEFMGITRIHRIAIENQEAGGALLTISVTEARQKIKALVDHLQSTICAASIPEPA